MAANQGRGTRAADGGESVTLEELACIPRDKIGNEMLIVSRDQYTPADGTAKEYLSARIWYHDTDGKLRPTKKGVTIRARELAEVISALQRGAESLGGSVMREQFRRGQRRIEPAVPVPEGELSDDDISCGGRL